MPYLPQVRIAGLKPFYLLRGDVDDRQGGEGEAINVNKFYLMKYRYLILFVTIGNNSNRISKSSKIRHMGRHM